MTFFKTVIGGILYIAFFALAAPGTTAAECRLNFNHAAAAYQDKDNLIQLKLPPAGVVWQKPDDKMGVLAFDGKSHAVLQVSDKLQKESFTVEIYCQPAGSDSNAKQILLFGVNPNRGAYWGIKMQNKWRLGIISGENSKDRSFNVLSATSSLNKWRRVAFVKDNSENMFRLYVDNELVKEQSFPEAGSLVTLGKTLNLGGALSGAFQPFSGLIGEVIIYDEARRYPAAVSTAYQAAETKNREPDPLLSSSWNELDKYRLNIVPAPKKIKFKERLKIDNSWHLVLLTSAAKAGVEEINRRRADCGAEAIPVNPRPTGNKIVVGTIADVKIFLKNNTNTELPPQGYLIDSTYENNEYTVIIAGADPDGVRYGCITFSMLLQDGTGFCNAQVVDYPDFLERMSFCTQPRNSDYAKKIIDEAFRAKINLIWGKGFGQSTANLLTNAASTRELDNYAKARGIRIVLGNYVNVGEADEVRKSKGFSQNFFPYKTDEGLMGFRSLAFTWSRDDLLDRKGMEWANFIEKSKINSFYMHSMDTGGRENPENWNNRTPMDRRRWGNDRAAADANLVNRMYAAMKKAAPDVGFYYVAYPYGGSYLQYPDVKEWLTKLSQLLPPDIYFCLRESSRENTEIWKNSTRQGIYLYHDPYPAELRLNYTAAGRYAATFRFTDRKVIYWFLQTQDFQSASIWTAAEYAWNTKSPGWDWFPDNDRQTPVAESVPPDIKIRLLPRICNILFGEKCGESMSQVFSIPLSCDIPGVMKCFYGVDNPESYFLSKYQHAAKSLTLMEKAAPNVKPSGLPFFETTKNFVAKAAIFNEARYRYFVVRRLLIEEKFDDAGKEIESAKEIIGRLPATNKLVRELNADLIKIADLKKLKNKKDFADKLLKNRKISLGVYAPYSIYQGVISSFDGIKSIKANKFDNPSSAELNKYNVIFFSGTTDLWDMTEDWRETVKKFVRDGGTVIFSHNAVGSYRQSALGKSLFPNIALEYKGKVGNQRQLKVATSHPILNWLKKDDIIEEEYSDHLWMEPGRDGTVLLRDADNHAVMIVGGYGKGRVIYTGQMFGYNRRSQPRSSEGDDWKLLLSMVADTP